MSEPDTLRRTPTDRNGNYIVADIATSEPAPTTLYCRNGQVVNLTREFPAVAKDYRDKLMTQDYYGIRYQPMEDICESMPSLPPSIFRQASIAAAHRDLLQFYDNLTSR